MPGTTIEAAFSAPGVAAGILGSIFLTEGLVLSQVVSLTGQPTHVLQNWVKRGFVSPPVNKKYSRSQFCRIAMINFLKDCLQLDSIVRLIGHVNGSLAAETDDLIDDYELYCYFVDTLALGAGRKEPDDAIVGVLAAYREPFPGAGRRVAKVLKVMRILYESAWLKKQADIIIGEIE